MAQTIRIMHTTQDSDELSKDRYVNTFYSSSATTFSGPQLASQAAAVKAFYTTATSSHTVKEYMAGFQRDPGATIKIYNVDMATEHEPIYEETYLFDFVISVANLPGEVALALSFRADPYVVGVPQARQRGRIYVGPLNVTALASGPGPNDHSIPHTNLVGAMNGAGVALGLAMSAGGGKWVIHSPAQTATLGAVYNSVVHSCWVDNAFDTQRRRGNAPTLRTTAAVA